MTDSAFDLVLAGTGYERNAHEVILEPARDVLQDGRFAVERNYRLRFRKDAVADDCGLWLQGCCQSSHGVSLNFQSTSGERIAIDYSDS